MRFAASMARMGHSVVLYESNVLLGGHLRLLSQLPTREAWRHAIEDMAHAMRVNGVDVRLNTMATAESVLADHPDQIVVATGSDWVVPAQLNPSGPRAPVALALDRAIDLATEAADTSTAFGRRAVIYDSSGTYAPLGLADALSFRGVAVTLITPDERLSQTAFEELDLQHVMPRLAARGVQRIIGHTVAALGPACVVLSEVWGGAQQRIDNVDSVVFACLRQPRTSVFEALRARHPYVDRVGDALSPRSTAAVIHEAEALARRV
jgi:pyruvate/2-oxoglutarate dehydrogenase complex dihydrolipoamide dehydrogenase (E3) component